MIYKDETFYMLALSRMYFFHIAEIRLLLERVGSAKVLFEHRKNIHDILPECNKKLLDAFLNCDEALKRAEEEMLFTQRHGIRCLTINDADYPALLSDCDDAPIVLFVLGGINLNRQHIVSVVGTRRCTEYGRETTERFVRELREICPDAVICSGLAYGIDIVAHRAALEGGMDTIGVLAHGLDTIYPASHRNTAKEVMRHGGLVTEYFQNTNADKMNFLRRNRIIAGLSCATVVIESAYRGGSLSTARIAGEYNRDVFAVPGRIGDQYSEGCNELIAKNKGQIFTSAYDFALCMGWTNEEKLEKVRANGIQRELFPSLTDIEKKVVGILSETGDMQINMLAVHSKTAIPELSSVLFNLEMAGVVKMLPGGVYHLIQ
ncbi:MAG: DNA-protecting protein DprA [Bacteroidaceae bacterium]|nr:DNA-protecting protein DprA [Bacteroidaceae bacterium]